MSMKYKNSVVVWYLESSTVVSMEHRHCDYEEGNNFFTVITEFHEVAYNIKSIIKIDIYR